MSAVEPQITICPMCRTVNRADARFCQRCGSNIVLDDTYRIVRIIKEGGMGTVYQALDAGGQRYAVKELIDRFAQPGERAEAVERFLEEARILRGLRHPSIPRVYRSFLHGGRYYLAMEYIDGEDLEELQRRARRFDEETVLRWADQIADVLDHLHRQGVIYRDVKPSNIMIEQGSGAVKVVDFGIAKLFQPAQRGTLIGTPGYAPPEQYQGLATPQSDVYALGATLHHLLTGRDPRDEPPFSFPPLRTLAPQVSTETASVIERALQMEVAARWPSAQALRQALPLDRQQLRTAQPTTVLRQPSSKPAPPLIPEPVLSAPRVGARALPQPAPLPGPRRGGKRPAQAAAPARRGPARGMLALIVVALTLLYLAAPDVRAWVGERVQQLAGATATPQPLLLQELEQEVEVLVPEGSSSSELYDAFASAFEEQAKQQLGPAALLNRNQPPVYLQQPQRLGREPGGVRYRATMEGKVWAPRR